MTVVASRVLRRSGSVPPARRRGGSTLIGVLALVAGALVLTGCSTASLASSDAGADATVPPAASPDLSAATPTPSPSPSSVTPQPDEAPATLGRGIEPASLTVPKLGLTEALVPLGIQADGTMEVPADYDDVGYFTGGGRPGGIGPTVIAGHVDSRSGPAVFFRLGELVPGDRFTLTGVDGTGYEYEVVKVEDHAKAAFPTVDVFGAIMRDEVRLITCGGEYNEAIGRYVDNLVVFAARV
ncbi:class F sortase [Cryobacterium melibiosiphilum]|uniref:Class F sortase n=1 Tax=Cryobacterium melibiosiphilum TaxID=995039 RepID=A0A3A5M8P8_9MICO|nr:class F sortase [Cryobacterium melibiosiphilum]RJT85611.1 class F sortase [Cryobacterium melibiosiphilum]